MTDPTPLTDDELARIRSSDPRVADRGRLLATVDAERARADRAETSKAALVAKVKRLEDRLAVAKGALPAGDVREGWAAAVDRADQAETERDHLRAERDAARLDRVCWRETHNQVAAERDALRAEVDAAHASMRKALNPATSINDAWRLLAEHVGWHDAPVSGTPGEDTDRRHGKAEADLPESIPCPRCGGDAPWDIDAYTCRACGDEWPADSADTPDEHADGEPDYPLIDWRKANREQWERGTPGEDTAPADKARQMLEDVTAEHARTWKRPGTAPAEPVCAHPNRAFTVGGPDVSDGYVWCPDCRTNLTAEAPAEPVTGNQPRRRYVHPDPATQAQQVAADASARARRNSQETP